MVCVLNRKRVQYKLQCKDYLYFQLLDTPTYTRGVCVRVGVCDEIERCSGIARQIVTRSRCCCIRVCANNIDLEGVCVGY